MARALDLAWRGWGRVHPNPLVGAVVLAGRGRRRRGVARRVRRPARGARGAGPRPASRPAARRWSSRSSPATTAASSRRAPTRSSRAGVRRVVAAHRRSQSGGRRRRRPAPGAGIEVRSASLAEEAAAQNAVFLHRFAEPSRPFVALKLATRLDGRIADASGRSRWISGERARDYVHWLRAGFDAIGVGGRHRARRRSLAHRARHGDAARAAAAGRLRPGARAAPTRSTWSRTAAETPTIVVDGDGRADSARADAPRSAPGSACSARPRSRGAAAAPRRRASARCWSRAAAGWRARCSSRAGRPVLLDSEPVWLGERRRARRPPACRRPALAGARRGGAWSSGGRSARTPCSSLDRR